MAAPANPVFSWNQIPHVVAGNGSLAPGDGRVSSERVNNFEIYLFDTTSSMLTQITTTPSTFFGPKRKPALCIQQRSSYMQQLRKFWSDMVGYFESMLFGA